MSMFALGSRENPQQILFLPAEPGCLVRWLTSTVTNSSISLVTRQQEFKVQPNWNHPCYPTKHNVSYNWAAWTCWGRQTKWLLSLSSFPIHSFRFSLLNTLKFPTFRSPQRGETTLTLIITAKWTAFSVGFCIFHFLFGWTIFVLLIFSLFRLWLLFFLILFVFFSERKHEVGQVGRFERSRRTLAMEG